MNVIIHSDERNAQRDSALRDYGVDPRRATAIQKDMADCIAMKTNEAYAEARKVGRR